MCFLILCRSYSILSISALYSEVRLMEPLKSGSNIPSDRSDVISITK